MMIGGGRRVAPFLHLSVTWCFRRMHGAPPIHRLGGSVIKVAAPVASTLRCGGPVVALESAIITHGMPYPDNLQTALKAEQIIRDAGATPATIGVVSGRVIVGLSVDQLQRLARHDHPAMKTSRRDLPVVLAEGRDGGTTVSGTLVVAARVGIPVFVTGGIGGVHRGAENSMDVSADLIELGRCSVCVVSAGVKSILDIGRTLEVLETQGVCVATLGPRGSFPAFFTDCSGHVSPHRVTNCAAAAAILYQHRQLALESGVLLAVPIPAEHQTSGQRIESAIQQALAEADEAAVGGRDLTPFVLSRVNQLTNGESLCANKHLIENNALLGARIAVEFCKLLKAGEDGNNLSATGDNSDVYLGKPAVVIASRGESAERHLDDSSRDVVTAVATSSGQQAVPEVPPEAIRSGSSAAHQSEQSTVDERTSSSSDETAPYGFNKPANSTATLAWSGHISPPLVVVGGSAMDFTVKLTSDLVQMDGSTYCGEVWRGPGGVARNIADALTRLGHPTILISAVGDDSLGYDLVSGCTHMDWSAVARSPSSRTASYMVTLNQRGRVMYVVGDMLAHQNISPHLIDRHADLLTAPPLVVTDGDTPVASLRQVALHCQSSGAALWFDPADTCHAHKVAALVSCDHPRSRPFLLYASPNLAELQAIHRLFFPDAALDICGLEGEALVTACMHAAVDIMQHFYCLIVTLGARGVMVLRRGSPELALCLRTADVPPLERNTHLEPEQISCVFYPVESESRVIGESGTGDCLNAGFISGLLSGSDQLRCVSLGLSAARQALCVRQAVPTSLHLPKTPAHAHAHTLLPSAART